MQRAEYTQDELNEFKQNQDKTTAMVSRYELIERELKHKNNTAKLALALGFNGKDEQGKTEAFKYISNILMEIKKTETSPNERDGKKLAKDLTFCTPESVLQTIIDAASFRLPIDGRKLAYVVRYGNTAQFQPGYKGFVYKLSEFYTDVDFTAEPVFEGDELVMSDNGGYQTYTHTRVDPFQEDKEKMKGLITCITYLGEGGKHSKTVTLSKSEIEKIKSKAKMDYIWNEWYFERAKAAALKRLCKANFASIMGLQALINFDNEKNYIMPTLNGDKLTPVASGVELSNLLEHQPAVTVNTAIPVANEEVVNA